MGVGSDGKEVSERLFKMEISFYCTNIRMIRREVKDNLGQSYLFKLIN